MSKTHDKAKTALKTPISYYGGKQMMIPHILPLIPEHKIYVEPFFGGGAVFWAKPQSDIEVINDANMNVVNFNEVLKHDYFNLKRKVDATLHSRETYKKAKIIYESPWLFDETIRAWAFWVVTSQGFAAKVGSWGFDNKGKTMATKIANKVEAFSEELSDRLRLVSIEATDAHKVITSKDSEQTFVYVDPPYINTNQGHYGGYMEEHFRRDLDALANMTGKFLLSTYPSEILTEYIDKHGWYSKEVVKSLSAAKSKNGTRGKKVEVLTANYLI